MALKLELGLAKIEIDENFIEYIFNKAGDLAQRYKDKEKIKEINEFLMYREFLVSHRKQAALLAAGCYVENDHKILDRDHAPILYKEGWMCDRKQQPIDLTKEKLEIWDNDSIFDFNSRTYTNHKLLPFKQKRYSLFEDLMIRAQVLPQLTLYDNPAYRLIKVECPAKTPNFTFALDTYFNYLDTCELIAFEFCRHLVEKLQSRDKSELTIEKLPETSLRREIKPFEFDNRSAVAGINTLLIVSDGEDAKFYLHERSAEKVAEAIDTIHVVPAGTFQPRHKFDAHHKQDFKFLTNLIRELAEELLGQEEFRNLSAKLTDIYQIEFLKKIDFFIKKGLVKAYFLGMGLDCLTLKPEILTALIIPREVVNTFLGNEFTDCFEGKHFEVELTEEQLDAFIKNPKTLPAGAACLLQAKKLLLPLLKPKVQPELP